MRRISNEQLQDQCIETASEQWDSTIAHLRNTSLDLNEALVLIKEMRKEIKAVNYSYGYCLPAFTTSALQDILEKTKEYE